MTSGPCYRQERASLFVERRREIALISCCVVLLVTGLAGAAREVRIIVDDDVISVSAIPGFRVGDVLKQAGIELRDGDKVTPGLSERIGGRGVITVARGVPVTLTVDGVEIQMNSAGPMVKHVLAESGILLWPLDEDVLSYLCRLGVGSIGELQRMGQSVLVDMLGEAGYVIYQYSLGMDYSQVSAVFPQNGVTFSKAFDSPVSDWHALSAITSEGASHLMEHQDLAYMAVRRVEIALKCDNGHTVSCKKHLVKPVGMYGGLQRLCGHLLNEIFVTGHLHAPVEAVSISVYGSSPKKTGGQIDMLFPSRFSPYRAQASDEVMDEVICKVRERFGPGTVFPGREWKLTRRDKLFLASEGYIYEEGKRIASCCNGR
jgi:hypothetical protein